MSFPIEVREQGLYCIEGDFFIDAWNPVPVCLMTHAHGDHAFSGHSLNIAAEDSLALLKYRLGHQTQIKTYQYGEKFKLHKTWVSFHPAGHILGSAQIRIETENQVCIISGDYKRAFDSTCDSFEQLKCDIFVTESTFALPIYHWESSKVIAKKIYEWWQENQQLGISSIIFCNALGKAQRILALLLSYTEQPVYTPSS